MYKGKLVFSQVTEHIPWYKFESCVKKYKGDHRVKEFKCRYQFLVMCFAQLTYKESLRDIEVCLRSQRKALFHMGIRCNISRSTLADANETRDWRIYADFAGVLLKEAEKLYANDDIGIDIKSAVYALDSSTIDLCMSLFPWAKFIGTKSAIKLHTLLDLRGNLPSFIVITDGKVGDMTIMDYIPWEAGSVYMMDRGYLDYKRLYAIEKRGAFFITRPTKATQLRRLYSNRVDKKEGIIYDQVVTFVTKDARKSYPGKIRRIKYITPETGKILIFLTNHMDLPAVTIAKLYKARWRVELFFKWIKQNLRIKTFYGTSENAVKTQIWTAIATYLLVAIVKKKLQLPQSLHTILQLLSITIFQKNDVYQLVNLVDCKTDTSSIYNQLNLFDYIAGH